MFSLYDIVSLKEDDALHNVKKEYRGTIVAVVNNGKAFTIEFIDNNGNTIEDALFTEYEPNDIYLVERFGDPVDCGGIKFPKLLTPKDVKKSNTVKKK